MSFGFMISIFGFFLVGNALYKTYLIYEHGLLPKTIEEMVMIKFNLVSGLFMAFGGLALSSMVKVIL